MCYFIFHVVIINSFDITVITLITFYVGYVLFLIFNLVVIKKNTFLMSLFIIPAILSTLPWFLGTHQLGVHVK